MTCSNCLGECVIWEESIDEGPWEKARSRYISLPTSMFYYLTSGGEILLA